MVKQFFAVAVVLMSIMASDAFAVNPNTNASSLADASNAKNRKAKAAGVRVDTKLEQIALALVKEHLPELEKLIERLRKDDPRQYDLAIRDLAKSARKLETAKNRDEALFEIEVEILKTQSQAKLLAGKLKVRDSESDRKLLRTVVERLHKAEVARSEYNVDYLKDRVQRAQQQLATAEKRLATFETNTDAHVQKRYAGLLRTAGRDLDPNSKTVPKSRPKKQKK